MLISNNQKYKRTTFRNIPLLKNHESWQTLEVKTPSLRDLLLNVETLDIITFCSINCNNHNIVKRIIFSKLGLPGLKKNNSNHITFCPFSIYSTISAMIARTSNITRHLVSLFSMALRRMTSRPFLALSRRWLISTFSSYISSSFYICLFSSTLMKVDIYIAFSVPAWTLLSYLDISYSSFFVNYSPIFSSFWPPKALSLRFLPLWLIFCVTISSFYLLSSLRNCFCYLCHWYFSSGAKFSSRKR